MSWGKFATTKRPYSAYAHSILCKCVFFTPVWYPVVVSSSKSEKSCSQQQVMVTSKHPTSHRLAFAGLRYFDSSDADQIHSSSNETSCSGDLLSRCRWEVPTQRGHYAASGTLLRCSAPAKPLYYFKHAPVLHGSSSRLGIDTSGRRSSLRSPWIAAAEASNSAKVSLTFSWRRCCQIIRCCRCSDCRSRKLPANAILRAPLLSSLLQ